MLIADRWQNSHTHLKLTPRCNCFSPQQAVSLPEARILPAQLELTPGNSLPPPLPSVSVQHLFSTEMSSDRILCWNHSTSLLAAHIPSGWNLRRETPAGLSELKWSWSVTLSASNLPIILKHENILFYPDISYVIFETGVKSAEVSQPAYGISHLNRGLLEP